MKLGDCALCFFGKHRYFCSKKFKKKSEWQRGEVRLKFSCFRSVTLSKGMALKTFWAYFKWPDVLTLLAYEIWELALFKKKNLIIFFENLFLIVSGQIWKIHLLENMLFSSERRDSNSDDRHNFTTIPTSSLACINLYLR